MSAEQAVIALVEGNFGALQVCTLLFQGTRMTDLKILDANGIYGCRIYMLWADVCDRSIAKATAVLRAGNLGLVPWNVINHAIDNYGQGLDLVDLCKRVIEHTISEVIPPDAPPN